MKCVLNNWSQIQLKILKKSVNKDLKINICDNHLYY